MPYSPGFSAMMSDHRLAMTAAWEAYSPASPGESLRRASRWQSRQSARWTRNSPLIRYARSCMFFSFFYCRLPGGLRVVQVLWSLRMT